jgi:hypothetical protein
VHGVKLRAPVSTGKRTTQMRFRRWPGRSTRGLLAAEKEVAAHCGAAYAFAMKKLLRSFAAGMGSILNIHPQREDETIPCETMTAIGGDFSMVGKYISSAIQEKATSLSAPRDTKPHGEEKAEQLNLIPG